MSESDCMLFNSSFLRNCWKVLSHGGIRTLLQLNHNTKHLTKTGKKFAGSRHFFSENVYDRDIAVENELMLAMLLNFIIVTCKL